MFRSDGERRSFSLSRDITVIGRREDCDLRIPLGDVSRKHCRLLRDNEGFHLEDLGSSNGTYHNGQRVQEVGLSAGDSIQIGPVVFVLQVDGVPADGDLHPRTSDSEGTKTPTPVAKGEDGEAEFETLEEPAGSGADELQSAAAREPSLETMPGSGQSDFDIIDEPTNSTSGEVQIDIDAEQPRT